MTRTIIITRNGKTTVITGWRAWAVTAAGSLLLAALLVVLGLFMVGVALTAATFLVFVLPIAILLGVVFTALSTRR